MPGQPIPLVASSAFVLAIDAQCWWLYKLLARLQPVPALPCSFEKLLAETLIAVWSIFYGYGESISSLLNWLNSSKMQIQANLSYPNLPSTCPNLNPTQAVKCRSWLVQVVSDIPQCQPGLPLSYEADRCERRRDTFGIYPAVRYVICVSAELCGSHRLKVNTSKFAYCLTNKGIDSW